MYEEAIAIIQKYIDDYLTDDRETASIYPLREIRELEIYSYAKWAAEEILARVQNESLNPFPYLEGRLPTDVEDIIEQFGTDMDDCSMNARNQKNERMFFIAANTAYNILTFYRIERRNH